jgi:hypothetical protein
MFMQNMHCLNFFRLSSIAASGVLGIGVLNAAATSWQCNVCSKRVSAFPFLVSLVMHLVSVVPHWTRLLRGWAADGSISRATQDALLLEGEPELLKKLVSQWSAGDFSALPQIELLPASSMAGAVGAYVTSTGAIFLNADWLEGASEERVMEVLTEELGHHLDGVINSSNTPGDEGQTFALLLFGRPPTRAEREAVQHRIEAGVVLVNGKPIAVEISNASDREAPRIQGFSLESSTLDPSQPGGAFLSGALHFTDNLSGFSSGDITFISDAGQRRILNFYYLQGTRLAGTAFASAPPLDPYTAVGPWSLFSIELRDLAGNRIFKTADSSDWASFLSDSGVTQTSFTVAYNENPPPGTGPDSQAPRIKGLSLGSTTLDPSQPGGAFLSSSLLFTDNIAGFYDASITFTSEAGDSRSLYFFHGLQGSRLAGTAYSSMLFNDRLSDPFFSTGTWSLNSIDLRDQAGNRLFKDVSSSDWSSFLASSGVTQTSFTVAYGDSPALGPEPDFQAPSIWSFSLDSSTLDPSAPGGAFLSGRLGIRDDNSGFSYARFFFKSTSGHIYSLDFSLGLAILGSALNGTVFGSGQLNVHAEAGIYYLYQIDLRDLAGNQLYKEASSSDWTSFLASSGITQTSFQVVYNDNPSPGTGPDSQAPTIDSFSLDFSTLDPSAPGGAFLSGRAVIRDDVSGFSGGSFEYISSSGRIKSVFISYDNLISGSHFSGTYFTSGGEFSVNAEAGIYSLFQVNLYDLAGNYLSKSSSSSDWSSFLASSGITQISFTVAYGDNPPPGTGPDLQAPSIESLSLSSSTLDSSAPGGALLSGRVDIRDDVSGFDYGYFNYKSTASGLIQSLAFSSGSIVSGTALSGTFFAYIQLAFAPQGSYTLYDIFLRDKAGNSMYKSIDSLDWSSFLATSGITQTSFTVVMNDGAASFTISGTPAVGSTLTATTISPDFDGNGTFSYSWQSSIDGNSWSPAGSNSSSYLVASADQGKQLRLVVSYTDGEGFPESVTTAAGSVPLVNDGVASFSIKGTPAVGNTLTAANSTPDPDGNGSFTYQWQASTDGTSWSAKGTNSSSYLVGSPDQGKLLRLVVSYTDGEGFAESVTTAAGSGPILPPSIPPGITVSPTSGLMTTEAGGTASFTVLLDSQPTADVIIGLSNSDTTEGTLSVSSLTFTSANWNLSQTVTVSGVDDPIIDGNIAYSILTASAVSSDSNYNGIKASDITLINIDNDPRRGTRPIPPIGRPTSMTPPPPSNPILRALSQNETIFSSSALNTGTLFL